VPESRVRSKRGRTFAALEVPNFRRYFYGQVVSLVGSWMQSIALPWLVLERTGSGTDFGLVVAVQYLPVMLLGAYGGLIVDRFDKRRLLIGTQAAQGLIAVLLGILAVLGTVEIWMLVAVALVIGLVGTVDNPARQSLVQELVGRDSLRNAVTLNSVTVNSARAVGPALAAGMIAFVGVSACFFTNAVSFAAVIVALWSMDRSALRSAARAPRERGQVRAGVAYVWARSELRTPLLMMMLVGTLAYEFPVSLALLAKQTLHGGASTYSLLTVALGAGAVAAGVWVAGRGRTGLSPVAIATAELGIAMLATAVAPNVAAAVVMLFLAGLGYLAFNAIGNSTIQLACEPAMRGRVMALWTMWFQGSTVIGSPIIGYVGQHLSARWAVALGGVAALLASMVAVVEVVRIRFTSLNGALREAVPESDLEPYVSAQSGRTSS
jgi:MFS family permease